MKPPALDFQNGYKQRKNNSFMGVNLFDLHDPERDACLRKCLRIYGVLPKHCSNLKKNVSGAHKQAIWFNKSLRKINKKLKKKIGFDWTKEWIEIIPYEIKGGAIKDWFCGRSSPPLIAIEKLKELGCENEVNEIFKKAKYVSSTTRDVTCVPKELTLNVAYLTGLILGDGCLPNIFRSKQKNFEYGIVLFGEHEEFFKLKIIPLIKEMFKVDKIKLYYKRSCWKVEKRNKVMFRFFTKFIGLQCGKKAINARVPKLIFSSDKTIQIAFIAGLIDSDIGKHCGGMGCTFRSEAFVEDLVELMHILGVNAKKGGTYLIKTKYSQTDFRIPKSEVKALKDILSQNYLPKRIDRLKAIKELCVGTKTI